MRFTIKGNFKGAYLERPVQSFRDPLRLSKHRPMDKGTPAVRPDQTCHSTTLLYTLIKNYLKVLVREFSRILPLKKIIVKTVIGIICRIIS